MKNQKDIRLLRFFHKKTMLVLVGCDSRIPEKVERYKWNPCAGCPDEYKKFVNCNILRKKELIPSLEKKFDIVASPDECSGLLQKPYFKISFPRNIDNFLPAYPEIGILGKIKILHAPSNNHYKGTRYIRNAMERLSVRYDNFEYIEKQGLSIDELHQFISSCDLVIDQLIVGYYGLLSVESMAMGKPVVAYIRPDIWEKEKGYSPVFNANPDNLFETIERILIDPDQLGQKGKDSRAYVEKYHDSRVVANAIYLTMNTK